MKKIVLISFTLLFVVSCLLAMNIQSVKKSPSSSLHHKNMRVTNIAYQETFENGNDGWTFSNDVVAHPNEWHSYNSPTDGAVWWMGDTALASGGNPGGYYDAQYLVLDTPTIAVPTTNPTLTFRVKYNVEAPAGAEAPYTGWDASNVRISTNNGATWTVITGTPAYNVSSAYSFGYEHFEGPNVPGWGGNSNGWQNASFSLAAYAGQNVKIRFAFASDPAFSTADSPALFGMMIDNIALGSFTSDGTPNTEMVASNLVPPGGQLWHVAEVGAGAPSPTHAMVASNATTTGYVANMKDYLISPNITLPANGTIKAYFSFKGPFNDPEIGGTATDLHVMDYWVFQISVDNGTTWLNMTNPYGDPNGNNYGYELGPDVWTLTTDLDALAGDISNYAGQTVKFRIFFSSDYDTPEGVGFMVDDFTIANELFVASPSNLNATLSNRDVTLNWIPPLSGVAPHDTTTANGVWTSYVSDAQAYAMKISNPTANPIALSAVNFMMYVAGTPTPPFQGTATVRIYANDNNLPGAELANFPNIGDIEVLAWKRVDVSSANIMIPANGSIFVGVSDFQSGTGTATQGLLADATSTPVNTYALIENAWQPLNVVYTQTPVIKNAAISATVLLPDANAPVVTGFKVYRSTVSGSDFTTIATLNSPTANTYTDTTPVIGNVNYYYVTAMYGDTESPASATTSIYVLSAQEHEIAYDDGSAEQGFNAVAGNVLAVKVTDTLAAGHGSDVLYVKVFVQTLGTGPMTIRIYDADGANGAPGTQVSSFGYPTVNIVQGWNNIPVPTASAYSDPDGVYYVGILLQPNPSTIGLDTSSHTNSWKRVSNVWSQVTDGNIMIRVVTNSGVGIDEPNQPAPVVMSLNNYPNPFNPSTTITYSLPKAGQATVKIYNIKGQVVRTLQNGLATSGTHKLTWDGTNDQGQNTTSGVYFMKLQSAGKTLTQKMVLMK